jgi:hypothetical protein
MKLSLVVEEVVQLKDDSTTDSHVLIYVGAEIYECDCSIRQSRELVVPGSGFMREKLINQNGQLRTGSVRRRREVV